MVNDIDLKYLKYLIEITFHFYKKIVLSLKFHT